MPRQFREINRVWMRERDIHCIAFARRAGIDARRDVEQILRGFDDSLGEQESRGQLAVVFCTTSHDQCMPAQLPIAATIAAR